MTTDLLSDAAAALLETHGAGGVDALSLTTVLESGSLRELQPDELLCQQGAMADSLFFLLAGKVSVTRKDPDGIDRELTRVRAPAMVGHMAVIDRSPRSATVTAVGPVRLVSLNSSDYQRLLSDRTPAGAAMRHLLLTSLTRQLGNGNARIRHLINGHSGDPQPEPAAPVPSESAPVRALPQLGSGGQQDLMEISDILDGWNVPDDDELDEMEVVYTEEQKRNKQF